MVHALKNGSDVLRQEAKEMLELVDVGTFAEMPSRIAFAIKREAARLCDLAQQLDALRG